MKCERCNVYEAYGPNVGAALRVQNICSQCYRYTRETDLYSEWLRDRESDD